MTEGLKKIVNILDFEGPYHPAAPARLCHYPGKAATDKVIQRAWLCSSKTLFIKTGGDFPGGPMDKNPSANAGDTG